ncbi:MAG: SH3b protein [Candidatus Levybacteria bacterium]|nr:SH3b protein [Candidatus Levybacteria bacterium]
MPAKNLYREHGEGVYSHIYNKGVEKRAIFNDEEDYEVFKSYLRGYLSAPQDPNTIKKSFTVNGRIFRGTPHLPKNYFGKVELMAYSLMPGHFHLLLHQLAKGALENFIRSLCTRYSMYFNKKYRRTGALFEGPYKSIQIKDGARLPHLTRFFHSAGDHSSYSEYLGTKETSWVKPWVVLAFFSKGAAGYKDFVEKDAPDPKLRELLEGITFESETEHLERREPTRNVKNCPPEPPPQLSGKIRLDVLKPWQRIPEILVATVVFFLLLTFGIRNIMVSTAKSPDSPSSSEVLSTTAESLNPSVAPTLSPAAEELKPKMILTVIINDGATSVNIRQKPTVSSEKIGEAKNGERFEFVSENSGWYEVGLTTGTGFISAKYIEVREGNK